MKSPVLISIAFIVGLGVGWFGKTWFGSYLYNIDAVIATVTGGNTRTVTNVDGITMQLDPNQSSNKNTTVQSTSLDNTNPKSIALAREDASGSVVDAFKFLLEQRQYFNAMVLFQEQKQSRESIAAKLKVVLLKELEFLIESRNNSDFSTLVENYLSIYYDDIDVLLLLAHFNQVNSSYLEVVNVFLLAKTYAYSDYDRERVESRLNGFVLDVDSSYTGQEDWISLINFYAHIDTSGLMTSSYQYRQAIAHLRSGDEAFAIEQFRALLNDSLVGESANKALDSLLNDSQTPTIVYDSLFAGADKIELQKVGNQYAVNLSNARQDSVTLLIDTGASMTAMSLDAFNKLNYSGEAVEQDRRVFRTASGVVQGTVFSVPELILGKHRLENTQIAVIDFGREQGIEGLLGMNILGQFRFQIDQERSQLLLSDK